MIRAADRCPKPGGPQVGVENVVFQRLAVIAAERLDDRPVAAFDVRVDQLEQVTLSVACGCSGRNRAAHKEQRGHKDFLGCVSRQRHRKKQELITLPILAYLQH